MYHAFLVLLDLIESITGRQSYCVGYTVTGRFIAPYCALLYKNGALRAADAVPLTLLTRALYFLNLLRPWRLHSCDPSGSHWAAPHISPMRISFVFLTVLSLSLSLRTRARVFILEDQWRGDDFFRDWNWETENDPTHGRINYVSRDDAISKHLAYSTFCPQVASPLVVARWMIKPIFSAEWI